MAGGCGDDDLVRSGVEAAVGEFDAPNRHFVDQVAAGACAAAILKCGGSADKNRTMFAYLVASTGPASGAGRAAIVGVSTTRRTLTCL